jgi:hypothetical protein
MSIDPRIKEAFKPRFVRPEKHPLVKHLQPISWPQSVVQATPQGLQAQRSIVAKDRTPMEMMLNRDFRYPSLGFEHCTSLSDNLKQIEQR